MKMLWLSFLLACAFVVPAEAANDYLVYIGSYTDPPSTSKGIYAARFDADTGNVMLIGPEAETVNPAYVVATPDGRFLYAANWQTEAIKEGKNDTVTAYAVNRKTGALSLLNKVDAGGQLPNEVIVDRKSKLLVATNYGAHSADQKGAGIAAFAIEPDGKLSDAFYVDLHPNQPLSPRQTTGAHTHGVIFTKDDQFAFVADLGLDRVYTYRVDAFRPSMEPFNPPFVTVSAGSGPRRMQLSPNGRFLYVNNETNSTVSVFSVRGGNLKQIQNVSTIPADYKGRNTTAEMQIDEVGKFLYVSNRGNDSIAIYSIDPKEGTLALQEIDPALGKMPRNITIDPSGRYLFSANQGSNNVVVFRRDEKTGQLTPTGQQLQVPQPGSVFFVKAE